MKHWTVSSILSPMFAEYPGSQPERLWYWAWPMKPQSIFRTLLTNKVLKVKRRQSPKDQLEDPCNNQHTGTHHNKVQGWAGVAGFQIREAEAVAEVIKVVLEGLVALTLHQEVWVVQEEVNGLICIMEEVL